MDDPDNYLALARSLAEGRGFSIDGRPTAYRPPLYPILLAPAVALLGNHAPWGVAVLNLAVGGGTVALTAVAARRWGLSRGRALLAAGVVALDPVLISQSRSVMTETLAAFLFAAALAGLTRPGVRGATLGGLAFGLGSLCRPTALPVAVLAAVAALVRGPGSKADRLRRAAALALATAVPLVPWGVRNALVLGELVITTTHGGYTLYLANNPVYYDEVVNGPPGAVWTGRNQWLWWDSVNHTVWGAGEPAADRAMRAAAIRFIGSRPRDFARASAARLGRFWGLAPSAAVYPAPLRLASAAWTVPLWIALFLGLCRRQTWCWPRVAAPATLLGLTLVHAVFWTDQRMRAPAVPAVALVAASAGFCAKTGAGKKSKIAPDSSVQIGESR